MTDTPNLGLPFIEAAQAQKHVTHNEALALLDAFVQTSVLSMSATQPPAQPAEGARVVVGAGAGGVFAGRDGQLAMVEAGAWRFFPARVGWQVWSVADRCAFVHDGAAWVRFDATVSRLQQLTLLGVGTTADQTNPLAVRAGNALFTARLASEGGDGSLRFKLNKEAAAQTVSQLYQTNWSGRAETGLVGDDRWRVRVSSDGQSWSDPLIASTTGVEIGGRLAVAGAAGAATREVNPGAGAPFSADTFAAALGSHRLTFGSTERFRFTAAGELQMGGANTVLTAARHLVLRAYTRAAAPAGGVVGETIFITNPASGAARPFHWSGVAWLDGAGVAA